MAKKMTTKDVIVSKMPKADKLSGLVTIVATEKSNHMVTGEKYEVSPQLAETLVSKGFATIKK